MVFDPTMDIKNKKESASARPIFDPFDAPQQNKRSGSFHAGLRIPEQKLAFSRLANETSNLEAGLIGAGKGFYTVGRGLGLVDEADETEKKAYGQLKAHHPISTATGEVIGESAPFVPLGVGAGSISNTLGRVAATSLVGGMEGGTIAKGSGGNSLTGAVTGAVVGGASELVLPYLMRSGSKLFKQIARSPETKRLINAQGGATPEFVSILEKAGVPFSQIEDDAFMSMSKDIGEDATQKVRKEFLESQGIKPTKAQITRDATDFQTQQELTKKGGRVRTAIEGQESVLSDRFDSAANSMGNVSTSTNTVVDNVISKSSKLSDEISSLYKEADKRAGGGEIINLSEFVGQLRRYLPSNSKTSGNITSILGELKHRGVIDKQNRVIKNINVKTAEEIRQFVNTLHDPTKSFANTVNRSLKESLDDDVFKAAGDDLYKSARKAKSSYETGLSRARVSRFDSRKANLVRDIQENKINPDTFIKDVVFSKKWRGNDIAQLKSYIDNPAVWGDMRAQVLDHIKEMSFIGPEDSMGYGALSADKLNKAINSIGWGKLDILFNSQERKFLKDMLRVSKLRQPVRATQQGLGPTAQAVQSLEKRLAKLPILGNLVEFIDFDSQGRAYLKSKVKIPITAKQKQIAGGIAPLIIPATQNDDK